MAGGADVADLRVADGADNKVTVDGGAALGANAVVGELVLAQGDVVRAVTEPMSAEKMHALAQNIRRDGNGLFFAALEEEIC